MLIKLCDCCTGVPWTGLMQCNTSPLHRFELIVDYGLQNFGPLPFNGCAKLPDIGRNANSEHHKHAQWVLTCLVRNWVVSAYRDGLVAQQDTHVCLSGSCVQLRRGSAIVHAALLSLLLGFLMELSCHYC